jgi:transposase-like protein
MPAGFGANGVAPETRGISICKINGELVYLWRAVDQSGKCSTSWFQKCGDAKAAKRFFRKLLTGHRTCRVQS